MHFKDIKIDRPVVSIFANGESVKDISYTGLRMIRSKSFTIGINDFHHINVHARFWYDLGMTLWFLNHKDYLDHHVLITRKKAIDDTKFRRPYYVFDETKDGIQENWSASIIIQLILKYFPGKKILLFGYDCKPSSGRGFNKVSGEKEFTTEEKYTADLERFKVHMQKMDFQNVWNCNLDSEINMPKKDYNQILIGSTR